MPFFIPLLIGASLLSLIPSIIPQEQKRAQEVIREDGNNYFNRQTMRNGNQSFNNHKKERLFFAPLLPLRYNAPL